MPPARDGHARMRRPDNTTAAAAYFTTFSLSTIGRAAAGRAAITTTAYIDELAFSHGLSLDEIPHAADIYILRRMQWFMMIIAGLIRYCPMPSTSFQLLAMTRKQKATRSKKDE